MEHKIQDDNQQGKPLKKFIPLGKWQCFVMFFCPGVFIPLFFVFIFCDKITPETYAAGLILFACFGFALPFANLYNFTFRLCIRIYEKTIYFPILFNDFKFFHKRRYIYHVELDELYKKPALNRYAFYVFKFEEIIDCHFAEYEKKAIIITTNDNDKWRIRNIYMSYWQWKQIIGIIKKYAGSKSGIPEDEFRKNKKKC